ncbi:serine protease [Prosthecobacter sp.]|uniref:serine protease n=1 Tax=Prosthecobacter sp. TaxID=1965333 RepID=UPI003782D9CC
MRTFSSILGLLCFAAPAVVNAMVHHIEAVTPRAGQRGTTVEVILDGAYLKDPREVLFFRPGIKCVEVKALPPMRRNSLHHGGYREDQVQCTFEIAPDCPLGLHPLKLRTATELTTLSTFAVTAYPVYHEVEQKQGVNDATASAEVVPLGSSVHGRIDSVRLSDVDLYRVSGKAGQHLSVEVDSVWLTERHYAESEFDLMVRLLDANGKELARNDDSALHLQDPIASIVLPKDGDYLVEIKQRVFKDGPRCYYLAHIGDHARPLVAYPAGGKAGTSLQTTLLGDPAGEVKQSVVLPAAAGDFSLFNKMPSPLPMRVSAYDNVLEEKSAEETAVKSLPAALNGVIEAAGDSDAFKVSVKKGERWHMKVFARSLGTPLDPRISIQRVGAEAAEVNADDATLEDRGLYAMSRAIQRKEMMDPAIVWEPKEDGEYVINITDMRGLGDATSVYRIEVEAVRDEIDTFLQARVIDMVECPRLTGITVPQGGQWTVNVNLADGPGNTYKGELDLVAHGLPKGVTMIAPRVRAGQRQTPVQFVAEAGVKPQCALISLECKAVDGRPLVSHSQQSFPFLGHSGGRAWHSFVVDHYALAVMEPPPFNIEVAQPQIPLSQNGELSLAVKVARQAGFKEDVEYQFDWVPNGVEGEPTITLPADKNEGTLRLSASTAAAPGTYQLAITASTVGGEYYLGTGRTRTSTKFFDLTIAQPYIALKSNPTAVRRGEKAQVVWDIEHKKPFEGEAEATLLGLPKGVSVVNAPRFKPGDKQLIFEIAATSEALLGQYKELSCEITVTERGQQIRQRMGKGILRVDPAIAQTSNASR